MKLSPAQIRELRYINDNNRASRLARWDTLMILKKHGLIEPGDLGTYWSIIAPAGREYLEKLGGKS